MNAALHYFLSNSFLCSACTMQGAGCTSEAAEYEMQPEASEPIFTVTLADNAKEYQCCKFTYENGPCFPLNKALEGIMTVLF